jgi:GNAT superfamily N-acetyltransferase
MIKYKKIAEFERGILYRFLCESYEDLLSAMPDYINEYKRNWEKFDLDAFNNPYTIGQCILVSVLDESPIGFVSWDPRRFPEKGEIGQNCIIPDYRGKGYGKLQIQKVLSIFQEELAESIIVTTADHPFFDTAKKMYLSCGFKESEYSYTDKYGGFKLINFKYKFRREQINSY